MPERLIKPVKDNTEKMETYRHWLGQYNKAVKCGCYHEALLIDYAMLEDRLKSLLYHMGAYYDRNSYKANKGKAVKYLREIVVQYKRNSEDDGLNVSSISGKRKIIRSVLTWASETEYAGNDKYLRALKSQCESIDTALVLQLFDEMEKWCDYRNEIIHALMNKNIYSVTEELAAKVEEGYRIARELDSQIRIFKKGGKVRKAAGLGND